MGTSSSDQRQIQNLPPHLQTEILVHLDASELAQARAVCVSWRKAIESRFPTRLEMYNGNWRAFVKRSTTSNIHLKLVCVQYPIYLAPEFKDFMSRVNILELTGYLPDYILFNILNGCRKLQSITINHATCEGYYSGRGEIEFHGSNVDVTQLNIGQPKNGEDLEDFSLVTSTALLYLKPNCLKELNLSSYFEVQNTLRWIFASIFEQSEPDDGLEDLLVTKILPEHRQSLQLINFNYKNGPVIPTSRRVFIKFHPHADVEGSPSENLTNQIPQICESNLYHSSNRYFDRRGLTEILLKIFDTQFRMHNLDIYYRDQSDLDRIENIIKNNCGTLEEITVSSIESAENTYRSLSCSWFATCLALKKLTLCADYENRKVKLLDLLLLPTSLKKLSLNGFILTGSSELFGGVTEPSQYPNLTEVVLGQLPWFIQDGNPVIVFENTQLRWVLDLFSKIRKLTLKELPIDQVVSVQLVADTIGMDNIPDLVSPEFVNWCRHGGDDNVKIESIEVSHDQPNVFHGRRFTVHQILIGNHQH